MPADTPPRKFFRGDISIGNLITIGSVVVGLSVGWTQLRSDQENMKADFERRLIELEQDKKERAVRDLANAQMFAEMRADIRYTRQAIERLERAERENGR